MDPGAKKRKGVPNHEWIGAMVVALVLALTLARRIQASACTHARTQASTWARTCVLVRACTYAIMAQAADPFLFAIPASKCLVVQPVTNSEISDQLATAT